MEKKLLSLNNNESEKNLNIKISTKQKLIILGIMITIIIILFFITYFNSPNRLKRYLLKEKYECATHTCTKQDSVTSYVFNYKNGNLTVTNDEYTFTINDTSYTYTKKSNNLTCTYDNNGDIVREEHNNPQECSRYHDAMNNVINYYNLTIQGSKFKKK